jgi:hypothetical protein
VKKPFLMRLSAGGGPGPSVEAIALAVTVALAAVVAALVSIHMLSWAGSSSGGGRLSVGLHKAMLCLPGEGCFSDDHRELFGDRLRTLGRLTYYGTFAACAGLIALTVATLAGRRWPWLAIGALALLIGAELSAVVFSFRAPDAVARLSVSPRTVAPGAAAYLHGITMLGGMVAVGLLWWLRRPAPPEITAPVDD